MKKVAFIGMAAIIALAAWSYSDYQRYSLPDGITDLMLANIEALADEETEGTPVADCYIRANTVNQDTGWHLFCSDKTSSSMIYPCGTSGFGTPGTKSMCTTK